MVLCFGTSLWAQQSPVIRDSTSTTFSFNNINVPDISTIVNLYSYDPITNRYYYTSKIGEFDINFPIILTPKEFEELIQKENIKSYYKEKIEAYAGLKNGDEIEAKNLIPDLYINSKFFETIFGSNVISIVPQGSVEMDLGVMYTKQENPSLSPRNQSNFTFDFDQRISLSLMGKVGTRLTANLNYDTQSTFDFQNIFKLDFDPTVDGGEDNILQKLEIGNISMPLNSSLINGAQSLFGVKAELQFGKTRITGVFSEQRSESRNVVAQGGGTLQEFNFFGLDYDENRHFFLGHYFRNKYDEALENYPFINSQV